MYFMNELRDDVMKIEICEDNTPLILIVTQVFEEYVVDEEGDEYVLPKSLAYWSKAWIKIWGNNCSPSELIEFRLFKDEYYVMNEHFFNL